MTLGIEYINITLLIVMSSCIVLLFLKQRKEIKILRYNNKINNEILTAVNKTLDNSQKQNKTINTEIINKLEKLSFELKSYEAELELKTYQIFMAINKSDKELSPSASEWILNCKDIKKFFEPGKIKRVTNLNDNSEFIYDFSTNGNFSCTRYENGNKTFETNFTSYGAPVSGCLYDNNGDKKKEFKYNKLGQIEK